MKKTNKFQTVITILILTFLSFTACKKENIEIPDSETKTEQAASFGDFEIGSAAARSECPAGDVVLNTQAEVDSFATTYPNCTIINGFLNISGGNSNDPITSLEALSNVTEVTLTIILDGWPEETTWGLHNIASVGEDLVIDNCDNLENLDDLVSLTSIGGDFVVKNNEQINHLVGVEGNDLTVGGALKVKNNSNLSSLTGGMDGMGYITIVGSLVVENNPNLTSLVNDGADDMGIFMPNEVRLINNPALVSLEGLHEVEEIAGDLIIENSALVDLSDLASLESISGNIEIRNNAAITSWMAEDQDEWLLTFSGDLIIDNNASLTSINITNEGPSTAENITIKNNANLSSLMLNGEMELGENNLLIVQNNAQLATCAMESICEFLDNGGQAIISQNAGGCNTVNQVKADCAATMDCGTFEPMKWASNIKPRSAKINWHAVNEADNYKVRYRKKNSNHPWKVKQTTNTYKSLFNLLRNTNYEYQHKFHCPNGWSTWGELKFFKTKP